MNKYISLSLEELSKEATAYFMRHRMNGGASEFDSSINDISRAIIHAFIIFQRRYLEMLLRDT